MKIQKYIRLIKDEEIARRYFVMNSFDGALTILGVIIGLYLTGVMEARVVILSCMGAAVAMGVSGVWGAYAAERAERLRSLKELERHMLRDLGESRIGKNVNIMSFLVSLVNGLSPFLVSLILIAPFIAALTGVMDTNMAYMISFGLILCVLFTTGLFVGKIGKENMLVAGLRMALAGVVVGLMVFFIESLTSVGF